MQIFKRKGRNYFMIMCKNIHKQYKYKNTLVNALNDINISIKEGEMVAFIGHSGSGKSTLLNILGGLIKKDSGEYLFDDEIVLDDNIELGKFRRKNVGVILQNSNLILNKDVFYNIALPLHYNKNNKIDIKDKVFNLSKSLGIEDKLSMYPHMLSGGECQRVATARAIINNPRLIIADEPTSSLDEKNKNDVIEIFKKLNDRGITILLATHDNFVAQTCQTIYELEHGFIKVK